MQHVQLVNILRAAIISTTVMLVAPAVAGEKNFVFVPRADSPGNDLLRADDSSFEDCARRCVARSDCNAFTYNQLHGVCFLKYSANRVTTFYAFAITGIKLSPSVQPTAGAYGGGPSFVILPQADSPGNDYSRIDHFSFEDCRSSCGNDDGCNAFTYNHARGVCFLKRAANQWTTFSAWANTGIKLSSLQPKEKRANTEPAQPEVATPSEDVQPPHLPTAPAEPEVTTSPSEEKAPSEAEMRDRLCADMEREVSLPKKRSEGGNVRVDCLSRDYAIEVDRTEKWYEAVTQALHYSHLTGREPGIILVCYKSEGLCIEHALRLEETLSYWKLKATLWRCPQTSHDRDADCLKREVGFVP